MATNAAEPSTSQSPRIRLPRITIGGWSKLPFIQSPVAENTLADPMHPVNAPEPGR